MSKEWLNRNKRYFLPLIGILAFFLYILIFNVDFSTFASVITTVNLPLFIFALLVAVASVVFFAFSWKVLLSFLDVKVPSRKLFLYVLYGLYADIVFPAGSITGDVARVYLVGKYQKGVETQAVASVIAQRLLGMGLNIVTLVVGVVLIIAGASLSSSVVSYVAVVGVLLLLGLILIVFLVVRQSLGSKVINGSISFVDKVTKNRWALSRWKDRAEDALVIFRESMLSFKDSPRVLAVAMSYLILNWLCSFTIPYIIFFALGFPVSYSIVLVAGSIVVAIRAVPVGIPFEIGIPDIAMATIFIALGIPPAISAAVTFLSRMVTLWFLFVLGFIAQQWIETKPYLHIG